MTGVDKGFVLSFRCGTYPLHSNNVVVRTGLEPVLVLSYSQLPHSWERLASPDYLRLRNPLCCVRTLFLGITLLSPFLKGQHNIVDSDGVPSRSNLNCFLSFNEASANGVVVLSIYIGLSTTYVEKTTINILKNGKTFRFTYS